MAGSRASSCGSSSKGASLRGFRHDCVQCCLRHMGALSVDQKAFYWCRLRYRTESRFCRGLLTGGFGGLSVRAGTEAQGRYPRSLRHHTGGRHLGPVLLQDFLGDAQSSGICHRVFGICGDGHPGDSDGIWILKAALLFCPSPHRDPASQKPSRLL